MPLQKTFTTESRLANEPFFEMTIKNLSESFFDVIAFKSHGVGLSRHFEFSIDFFSKRFLEHDQFLGSISSLTILGKKEQGSGRP